MFIRRRKLLRNKQRINQKTKADVKPFGESGKLNKGFRYLGGGKIGHGDNVYQIDDYR